MPDFMKDSEPLSFLAEARLRSDEAVVETECRSQIKSLFLGFRQKIQFVHEIKAKLLELQVAKQLIFVCGQVIGGASLKQQSLGTALPKGGKLR